MNGTKLTFFLIFLASFAAIFPSLNADHDPQEDKKYWKDRANVAYNNTLKTYNPNPHIVASDTNKEVHRYIYFNCNGQLLEMPSN